jgi:hypothetical protein
MVVLSQIEIGLTNYWTDSRYSTLENKIIKESFNLIDLSVYKKSYHVTIITRKNRVVLAAENREDKTCPGANELGYYGDKRHSEYNAVELFHKTRYRAGDCEIFNVRVNKNREIALSAPCKRCTKLLNNIGFRRIWFTNNDGFFEELI